MCGICGVAWAGPGHGVDPSVVRQMNSRLIHRGPDEEGYFTGERAALAVQRLAIIDLQSGQQPLSNEQQNLWLVFNGEIYNYRQLRRRLEQAGHLFRSQSDTEVIVHAYEEYGAACLQQLNGMFAFALWDENRRRLFLARDRLGIKPLYYWTDGRRLAFASELKALLAWPEVPAEVDLAALDQYLTLEYIPSPRTILSGVCKLPAGHWLSFGEDGLRLQQYWEPSPQAVPSSGEQCLAMLQELLADAVAMQMGSDVPLGAFLSGGIDSSTVVALMRRATGEQVRTFSVGFDDATYNELPFARIVARRFDTEHHEETLRPDISALAGELVGRLDEPLADFSIFPTYLVSRMARRTVKVVLSGDGGDELFGGYDTYRAQQVDRYYGRLPAAIRQELLPALSARVRPRPAKKGWVNKARRFVQGGAQPAELQHARWMMFLDAEAKSRLYTPELWAELQATNGDSPAITALRRHFQRAAHLDPLAQQQYVDIKTYLADNILTKVDRMSMATSLEVRVPLLDHRLVEFALGLPPHLKLHRNSTKVILRQAMRDLLPDEILDRPKEGFSIPLKHWLRGPLQPLMKELLAEESIRRRGYFNPQTVAAWVDEHLRGRANHSHRLWALMVLELWQRQGAPSVVRQ